MGNQPQAIEHGRNEHLREYQRDWKRAHYPRDREKILDRVRKHRATNAETINRRRRERAAQKRKRERAAVWASYQQSPPDKSLPLGKQLRLWLEAKGWSVSQVAKEIRVSPRSVFDWLREKHPPVGRKRQRLFEITNLDCFAPSPAADREKKPVRGAQEVAAEVLKDLIVACGLSAREVLNLRFGNVEADGIRLSGGRFIVFGDGWHQVGRDAVGAWISLAKPREYLFFQLKPVERNRPANRGWVLRRVKAAGVRTRRSRKMRTRHFVGDFVRRNSDQEFSRHLRRVHCLSSSGAGSVLSALKDREASLSASGCVLADLTPQNAFDAFYPSVGNHSRKSGIQAAPRPKGKAGRPRGKMAKDSPERERLAALLEVVGKTQYKMVAFLYPEQHKREAAERATQMFLKRHRASINSIKATITRDQAVQELRSRAIEF